VDLSSRLVAYGLGPRMADLVCVVQPFMAHVNLGFYWAVELPDPEGLLTGSGRLHRHVTMRSAADIDNPAVRALLEAAYRRKKSNVP